METNINIINNNDILMTIEKKLTFNYDILEKFLIHHKGFKVGSSSYINYKSDIKKVYNHFEKNFNSEVEMLTGLTINDIENLFIEFKTGGRYKPSSFNRIKSSNFEFFKYICEKRHLTTYNLMDIVSSYDYKVVAEQTREKYIPTKEEVLKLIAACEIQAKRNYDYNVKKNKALISILASCGMRPDELLKAKVSDIVEKNGYFVLFIPKENCKTSIDRKISISGQAYKYLKDFLIEKSLRPKCAESEYIIPSQNGSKIATTDLNHLLNQLKEIVDIQIEEGLQLSIYCLRHYTASNLVKNKVDSVVINSLMGWATKENSMLSRYSNHDSYLDDVKAEVTKDLL